MVEKRRDQRVSLKKMMLGADAPIQCVSPLFLRIVFS